MDSSEDSSRREYSDAEIMRSVRDAFSKCKVEELPKGELELITSLRPINQHNLKNVEHSIRRTGFRRSEPLIVWHLSGRKCPVVLGSTRFCASRGIKTEKTCFAVHLKGLDRQPPTQADIWFACQMASLLEGNGLPRSPISKVIEIDGIMQRFIRERGISISNMIVKLIRDDLTDNYADNRSEQHCSHWSFSIQDNMLRTLTNTARCFRLRGLMEFLVLVEIRAVDPLRQVSQRFLINLYHLEMSNMEKGKDVLIQYINKLPRNEGTVARIPSSIGAVRERATQTGEELLKRGLSLLIRGLNKYIREEHDISASEIVSVKRKVEALKSSITPLP